MEVLKKHGILIDRDDEGYLLQLFTKPVVDRPTMFLKLFNVKELNLLKRKFKIFEAIEREQNRGTPKKASNYGGFFYFNFMFSSSS